MSLTIHILTRNNEKTIEKTLASVIDLGGKLLIGDLGSKDKTIAICNKFGAEVKNVSLDGDYSKVRNGLLKNSDFNWIFYIEPWEILAAGHDEIKETVKTSDTISYRCRVFRQESIASEIRLWNKGANLAFSFPIWESIIDEKACILEKLIIFSDSEKSNTLEQKTILKNWLKSSPITPEPDYYLANFLLSQKHYRAFIRAAEVYLSKNPKGMSAILMTYYLSSIQFYIMGDAKKSSRGIISCIAANPLMAEFWCLLGDMYYKMAQYSKAICFYENGMVLGSRRKNADRWPLEIAKYKKYPQQMIVNCEKMIKEKKYYKT